MTRGRIAVLMPAVYDELDKELLAGIHYAAASIGYDTLVFTGVSAVNTNAYIQGENNIYTLPFLADIDGIILVPGCFNDKALKNDIIKWVEKSGLPCVAIEEDSEKIQGVFLDRSGRKCRLFIENNGTGLENCRPKICTDSEELSFLENAELKARVECVENGVIVRIFM